MKRVIAVMSGKGGVGKSSVAVMIARILSETQKVVIVDFDICGPSVATALDVKGSLVKTESGFKPLSVSSNLDILSFGSILSPSDAVIWRGPKKQVFLELFFNSTENYDFVIIDTPPGISEEHGFLINKNTEVLVVTTPQNVALNDAQRCIEFCQANSIKILGVIENMALLRCECCNEISYPFGSKGGKLLSEEYGLSNLVSLEIEPEWGILIDSGKFKEEYKDLRNYQLLKKALLSCIRIQAAC